ncbi:hypothetical protein BC936DRAFT_149716 [Jimgerdemannia flammicorona]|uniref:Uncharacterized protein n=1 Tax=Jimgerdemannia flammicorona TaxID=994334 RepID=A0A433D085_9FUNG|nr:hypothetical protein BC936DRAFT_149716 [Jimgerdemannia flammicorona]
MEQIHIDDFCVVNRVIVSSWPWLTDPWETGSPVTSFHPSTNNSHLTPLVSTDMPPRLANTCPLCRGQQKRGSPACPCHAAESALLRLRENSVGTKDVAEVTAYLATLQSTLIRNTQSSGASAQRAATSAGDQPENEQRSSNILELELIDIEKKLLKKKMEQAAMEFAVEQSLMANKAQVLLNKYKLNHLKKSQKQVLADDNNDNKSTNNDSDKTESDGEKSDESGE